MITQDTHISEIRVGDIILFNDNTVRTVTPEYMKYDKFMGKSLFGDTYYIGYLPVKKVIKL